MELFLGSCKQTDYNISMLLDSLLECGGEDYQTIENLLLMNARIKDIQEKYDHIRKEFGLEETINLEKHSARQLVSQLSFHEMEELLDQFGIFYDDLSSKSSLEELIVDHGLFLFSTMFETKKIFFFDFFSIWPLCGN